MQQEGSKAQRKQKGGWRTEGREGDRSVSAEKEEGREKVNERGEEGIC